MIYSRFFRRSGKKWTRLNLSTKEVPRRHDDKSRHTNTPSHTHKTTSIPCKGNESEGRYVNDGSFYHRHEGS